jgi:superfamily I DNA/RNA helicase
MQSLNDHLGTAPLGEGQKVLALTFMHGSRRRLQERLGQLQALRGRTDCSTIDSFAWRLVRRWTSLAAALGFADVDPNQYERVCDAAGSLLQIKEVCGWVAATFPVLLVDEAQDMTANRLRIVEVLAIRLEVFAAADEFQCLQEELRPNPACAWLAQVCPVKELTKPRRTNIAELLSAAAAIRNGEPPKSEKAFMVALTSKPQLAGAWLNGNLQWYGGGKSVAVITPTLRGFAQSALAWAAQNKTKKGSGPYTIQWEASEANAAASFIEKIALQDVNGVAFVLDLVAAQGDFRVTRDLAEWMDKQRRALGKILFSKGEIENAINQGFTQRRRSQKSDERGWRGMTVHGAKNREFENVILLWPAATGGSDDQRRRLLYNAVTRAKERCLVLVQAKASLERAPFA